MADKALVKAKVQGFLADGWSAKLHGDGFVLELESAVMEVRVAQREDTPDGRVLIYLSSPFLWNVPATPEVFKYVALNADNYTFGHLSAYEDDHGSLTLYFSHTLLGDYLDQEELDTAIGAVLNTANDLDDELQKQFGGKRTFGDE